MTHRKVLLPPLELQSVCKASTRKANSHHYHQQRRLSLWAGGPENKVLSKDLLTLSQNINQLGWIYLFLSLDFAN